MQQERRRPVFELRWLCDEVDANEVKTGHTFIHCFSGTITAFYPASTTSATKGECGKSKHAAVRVKYGIAISKCITVGLTVTTF